MGTDMNNEATVNEQTVNNVVEQAATGSFIGGGKYDNVIGAAVGAGMAMAVFGATKYVVIPVAKKAIDASKGFFVEAKAKRTGEVDGTCTEHDVDEEKEGQEKENQKED